MTESPGHTIAGIPLLESKLYIPRPRAGLVSRPRLIGCLRQGIERKLMLVSAPAGFGKTMLLAEWLAATPANQRAAGWVSLDPGDNDAASFWAYFIAALQKVRSGVGHSALSLLQSPQPPPIDSFLTTLINEIHAIEDDFAFVLDDYHVIEAEPVHSGISFLLDHLPPRMHLVIASRSDPRLPLARLRARGELKELRSGDLSFTPDEATAFLNTVMGLDLSTADVAALEKRTEGWIAGLQLAALSMQGREDVSGFIAEFSGDDRYIVDYLAEEVLQRQPERVRRFLLQTSILERLSGPLCDAVTGEEGSTAILDAVERSNLFVVPLDDKRRWYRYHHLFADVLRAQRMKEHPDWVPALHRRASEWYESDGLPSDAIRHALAAEDFERAAELIEREAPAMRRRRQDATLLGWLEALPDELIRARPVLSADYAGALLGTGRLEAAEARLRDAERWLDASVDESERPGAAPVETVAVNQEAYRSLPSRIAIYRAARAQAMGDVPGTAKYARQALDFLSEEDHLWRGAAGCLLGLASWASGDLETAYRTFADGMASLRLAGNISDALSGTLILADIRVAQGRLQEAARTYERSMRLAMAQGEPVPRGTADLHVGLSELRREQGDLEAATWHLQKGSELGEHAALPENRYRWCIAMARIKEVQKDVDAAFDLLDEAERLYVKGFFPDVRPLAALRARMWLGQDRLNEAMRWVHEHGLSVENDVSYLREFEHLTLARVLIARHRIAPATRLIHEAAGLLERLLNAAEEGERPGSVVEILAIQALAHEAKGDLPAALVALERALILAEPEGYVRIFVDEGEPMRDLLRHATAGGVSGFYTRRLLSACDTPAPSVSTPTRGVAARLVKPLTAREVEILRLIAAGLRNQEIADQLFISLSTVKRHIANAYGKMDVRHRTQAVARATELNLL